MYKGVANYLNPIYVCCLFNIINSRCSFSLEDINPIYTRIIPYDLLRKIEDVIVF
ncbi:hypothetical protein NEIRO03_1789 [Nematocida sp. AWRm78]|nr:hypothetical protein NEIRO03_1789 [Nematocida sp. AWRm78]